MANNIPKISIIIAGATGVGKTSVACTIAERLKGEIISADARQIYSGMVVGTAAPIDEEVPHHLVGVLAPKEKCTAKWWGDEAAILMDNLHRKGLVPIIAGGTGLYIRALVEGLFEGPKADKQIRKELRQRADSENLHEELRNIDPESAERIHPNNTARIIRALEIYYQSGSTMTELFEKTEPPAPDWSFIKYNLVRPREELYYRIERRTEAMFDNGWVSEVRGLLEQGISVEDPGMQAIGYREIVKYIRGAVSLDEVKKSIKKATRNYAKRQLTWFRNRPEFIEIDLSKESDDGAAEKIIEGYREKVEDLNNLA